MAQCLLEPVWNSDGGLFRQIEASLSGVCALHILFQNIGGTGLSCFAVQFCKLNECNPVKLRNNM